MQHFNPHTILLPEQIVLYNIESDTIDSSIPLNLKSYRKLETTGAISVQMIKLSVVGLTTYF